MNEKHLKLIMELIFIFIIPLILICGTSTIEETYVYDNSGNFQTSKTELSFDNSIIKYYKNEYEYINKLHFNQLINLTDYSNFNDNGIDYTIYSDHININGTATATSGYLLKDNTTFINNHKYYIGFIEPYSYTTMSFYFNVSGDRFGNDIFTYNANGNLSIRIYSGYTVNNKDIYINLIDLTKMFGSGYEPTTTTELSNYINLNSYYPYTQEEIIYIESNNIISNDYQTNYTIWGNIKELLINNLDLTDCILLDLIICYTILWFIMFIIWHLLYLFFDMLIHIGVDWGHREREKVSK